MSKYRAQSGSVYEYDKTQGAYVFIGKLNGEKFADWIYDYEHRLDNYEPCR